MSVIKLVILGIGGVGKSCLTIVYCHNHFSPFYDPTIENSYRKQLTVDDEAFLLDIRDTAGQEDYQAIRDQHMIQGNGFLLVYSIDQKNSFQSIIEIYHNILRVKETDSVPVVLVGNKCDVDSRQVSTKEGKDLAKSINAPFFETSAKSRVNVDAAFLELVKEVKRWRATKEVVGQKRHKKESSCVII